MDAEALDATPSPLSPVSVPERKTTMTNHTDQDAREAREWAEYITSVRDLYGDYAPQARAAARFILDNTPPDLPEPLFGARAAHPEQGEGAVISHCPDGGGRVRFAAPDEAIADGSRCVWADLSALTFHTPDHPAFLETEEDYRSAPEGTIVAEDKGEPFVFLYDAWRHAGSGLTVGQEDMDRTRRRVLRWGREA